MGVCVKIPEPLTAIGYSTGIHSLKGIETGVKILIEYHNIPYNNRQLMILVRLVEVGRVSMH